MLAGTPCPHWKTTLNNCADRRSRQRPRRNGTSFFRPPGPNAIVISRRRWRWAAAGSVLSAALVAIVVWVGGNNRLPGISPRTLPVANLEDPAMIKAQTLAVNALPPAYLALSESLDGGYDKGFIDFLIPPLDDDSMS